MARTLPCFKCGKCDLAGAQRQLSPANAGHLPEDGRGRSRGYMRAPAQSTRDAVIEECAKIAEAQAREFLSPRYASNQPFGSTCERFACEQVAKAIRALSVTSTVHDPVENKQRGAPLSERHPVETLWREVGLPEYFLGNGGTNTKLYALYDAIVASDRAAWSVTRPERDSGECDCYPWPDKCPYCGGQPPAVTSHNSREGS